MTALQASLICYKPSLLSHSYSPTRHHHLPLSPHRTCFVPLSPLNSPSQNSQFHRHRHRLFLSCTLQPDNVNSSPKDSAFSDTNSISDWEELQNARTEPNSEVSAEKRDKRRIKVAQRGRETLGDLAEKGDMLPVVVFVMGLLERAREGLDRLLWSDWFSWLRVWRQERMSLARLVEEADANPRDAAKQSALLAELNKHRYRLFNAII